jgi:lipopolysaccharide transport system permease protein
MNVEMDNATTIYSSASLVRKPGLLFYKMFSDLWKSRGLAWHLMKRDISVLYRQSLLGYAWAFIPSIVTAATFVIASKNRILNIPETDLPYAAYVLFSVTLWQTFSEAVLGPVSGLGTAKSVITKINFPREALFLAKFGEAIFNFVIKSILITAIFIYFNISPKPQIFLALGLVFSLLILGQGIGLLLAPFNIIYQDIGKGLSLLLGLSMFVTPVVYPMPGKDTTLGTIVRANPVTYLISGIRDLSTRGATNYGNEIAWVILISIILFFFSWLVYRLSLPYVIERCP